MTRDPGPFWGGRALIATGLALGAAGLGGCAVGWVIDSRATSVSYLTAYTFVISVVLGLMAFVMSAHAMNAGWPTPVRRLAEMGFATMPLLVLGVLPLVLSDSLYPWMHPERLAEPRVRELAYHRIHVMNGPFFRGRAIGFVLLWALIALLLRGWSLAMDRPGAPDLRGRLRALSCAMLPLVGLTGTLAAFDWIMSLSPEFYSTMYGLYVLSGGFVAALGLLLLAMRTAERAGYLSDFGASHFYAMGRLLFAFLIFWAYIAFFQYLIIWLGNKPDEAAFYLHRGSGAYRLGSLFLIVGHFAVPWLFLLSYRLKRHGGVLAFFGTWILVSHYVDMHWLIAGGGAHRSAWQWQDLAALLLVGGGCLAFAVWRQRGHLLAATFDPNYARGVQYHSR